MAMFLLFPQSHESHLSEVQLQTRKKVVGISAFHLCYHFTTGIRYRKFCVDISANCLCCESRHMLINRFCDCS